MLLRLNARTFHTPRLSSPSRNTKENLFSYSDTTEHSRKLPALILRSSSLKPLPPSFHAILNDFPDFPLQQSSTPFSNSARPLSPNLIHVENRCPLYRIFPTIFSLTNSKEISKDFDSTPNQHFLFVVHLVEAPSLHQQQYTVDLITPLPPACCCRDKTRHNLVITQRF